MNRATVFSQARHVDFENPVTKLQVEDCLNSFLLLLGRPLSHNGVILGHIKILAKVPGKEDALFLSLTRLDRIDVVKLLDWSTVDIEEITSVELKINVLVFGHSRMTVEKVVNRALLQIRHPHE